MTFNRWSGCGLVLSNADNNVEARPWKVLVFTNFSNIENNIYCPECSAAGMGQFLICKQKWDLLRTSVTACTIDENTLSAPFGIFNVRTEIWKEIFPKQTHNWVLLFSNSHFQMGVTVMGFAEHFGQYWQKAWFILRD